MEHEADEKERSPEDLLKYPCFDEKEVVYLWRKDWWDGPLNGTVFYRECRYWFDLYCENGRDYYYLVFPLSREEGEVADAWHNELESLAKSWSALYEDPTTRRSAAIEAIADRIDAHHRRLPDFSTRSPVAWFVSGSNSSFYPIEVVQP